MPAARLLTNLTNENLLMFQIPTNADSAIPNRELSTRHTEL